MVTSHQHVPGPSYPMTSHQHVAGPSCRRTPVGEERGAPLSTQPSTKNAFPGACTVRCIPFSTPSTACCLRGLHRMQSRCVSTHQSGWAPWDVICGASTREWRQAAGWVITRALCKPCCTRRWRLLMLVVGICRGCLSYVRYKGLQGTGSLRSREYNYQVALVAPGWDSQDIHEYHDYCCRLFLFLHLFYSYSCCSLLVTYQLYHCKKQLLHTVQHLIDLLAVVQACCTKQNTLLVVCKTTAQHIHYPPHSPPYSLPIIINTHNNHCPTAHNNHCP